MIQCEQHRKAVSKMMSETSVTEPCSVGSRNLGLNSVAAHGLKIMASSFIQRKNKFVMSPQFLA